MCSAIRVFITGLLVRQRHCCDRSGTRDDHAVPFHAGATQVVAATTLIGCRTRSACWRCRKRPVFPMRCFLAAGQALAIPFAMMTSGRCSAFLPPGSASAGARSDGETAVLLELALTAIDVGRRRPPQPPPPGPPIAAPSRSTRGSKASGRRAASSGNLASITAKGRVRGDGPALWRFGGRGDGCLRGRRPCRRRVASFRRVGARDRRVEPQPDRGQVSRVLRAQRR